VSSNTEGKDQRELRTGCNPERDANALRVKADGSREQRGGENTGLLLEETARGLFIVQEGEVFTNETMLTRE
jgi:hypothetical protein